MLLQAQLVSSQTYRKLLCFSVLQHANGGNESNEGDEGWQERHWSRIDINICMHEWNAWNRMRWNEIHACMTGMHAWNEYTNAIDELHEWNGWKAFVNAWMNGMCDMEWYDMKWIDTRRNAMTWAEMRWTNEMNEWHETGWMEISEWTNGMKRDEWNEGVDAMNETNDMSEMKEWMRRHIYASFLCPIVGPPAARTHLCIVFVRTRHDEAPRRTKT